MKIVSWNCNLNFTQKYYALKDYDADIMVIQECEQEFAIPGYQVFWTGTNIKKGLGVLVKSDGKIHAQHNKQLINFLPIDTPSCNILGVWAYNHRAKKIDSAFSGNAYEAVEHYKDFMTTDKPTIIAGDFNNSVIWDKPNNKNNFQILVHNLKQLGFVSAYHVQTKEQFGQETNATFFHTKKETKPYHIDYIFTKGLKVEHLEVGKFAEWKQLSDHCPIRIDVSNKT